MSLLDDVPNTTGELNRFLRSAGLLILFSYIVLVPLSYGIAAVSPYGRLQPQEAMALRSFVESAWPESPTLRAFLDRYVSGDTLLAIAWVRTAAFLIPTSFATIGALFATVVLSFRRHLVSASTVRLTMWMAIAIALVNVVIYPMFTEDMWISIAWGRMLSEGHNPYYEYFTTQALEGTPLHSFPILMTYGPLWARIAQAIAIVGRPGPVWVFLVAKLVMFGFWTWALLLIRAILADRSYGHQAAALCFFGWWPASVRLAVGGGHNDIAMVCLLLLWLYMAERDSSWLAAGALTASILIKYVSAPLILVELWRGLQLRTRPRWAFITAVGCSVLAGLLVAAPLWRDWRFLQPVLDMQTWTFLTPAQAGSTILERLGIPLGIGLSTVIVRFVFGLAVLYYGVRYSKHPTHGALEQLVLAIMLAVLLAGVGHVWPWFVVWVLAPAAVAGRGPLWRLTFALALATPFMNLFWLISSGWPALSITGVLFFTAVGLIAACPIGWSRLEWGSYDDEQVRVHSLRRAFS